MSPLAYDPKSVVGGAAATLTVAGLAVGLIAGMVEPVYSLVAGAVGFVIAVVFSLVKTTSGQARTVARLGIGLMVGAALAYALAALGLLP